MSLSPLQQKITLIIPPVSAALSLLASSMLFFIILSRRVENTKTYTRIMLGIGAYDILGSLWTVLGPLPVVKGIGNLSKGNVYTCTAQGFFLYLGSIGKLAFSCCLLLYFVLVIRYKWTEEKLLKVEARMHAYALTVPFIQNIVGLILQIFNPAPYGNRCGIFPYPANCVVNPNVLCQRGAKVSFYVTYFLVVPSFVGLHHLHLLRDPIRG